MMRIRLIPCVLAALLAGGCAAGSQCEDRMDYKQARATRPIQVPDDRSNLSEDRRLDIPTASTPPDVDQRCLEKPPRYFEDTEEDG